MRPWLYGGLQIVDEMGKSLGEINSGFNGNCFAQIMGGAQAPIQASFIQAKMFFAVGGYNPAICGTEDLDLCRQIALRGNFANTSTPVACLFRGQAWSTSTNYQRGPEDLRHSRAKILREPNAFKRMLSSADSGYWYGRIFRTYITTALFHFRHRQLFAAMSRSLFGLIGFILAGRYVLLPEFWQAAKAHHAPDTLHFIVKALEHDSRREVAL